MTILDHKAYDELDVTAVFVLNLRYNLASKPFSLDLGEGKEERFSLFSTV